MCQQVPYRTMIAVLIRLFGTFFRFWTSIEIFTLLYKGHSFQNLIPTLNFWLSDFPFSQTLHKYICNLNLQFPKALQCYMYTGVPLESKTDGCDIGLAASKIMFHTSFETLKFK